MAYLDTLGTRIRERRTDIGLKQAELAQAVGISASYLNLIEHNRRRIGGKLLSDIAECLDVEPALLAGGAEAALLTRLRVAVSDMNALEKDGPDIDRLPEFAGRFPGWAALLDRTYQKLLRLEAKVEALSDRLTHDASLSTSLHEVLTTAAAIRSTADILAGSEDIDETWRRRFHLNMQEESHRLSQGAQSLLDYLDQASGQMPGELSEQEELETWLSGRRYYLEELEHGGTVESLLETVDCSGPQARAVIRAYCEAYAADVRALPHANLLAAIEQAGLVPLAVSQVLGVDLDLVLRRLATLPDAGQPWEIGRVACDGSGHLTFRKPITGFQMPRRGAACPLWPLYRALMQPNVPVQMRLQQVGALPRPMMAFAHARARLVGAIDGPLIAEAQMIVIADTGKEDIVADVGQACRICPRGDCPARREPSLVTQESN